MENESDLILSQKSVYLGSKLQFFVVFTIVYTVFVEKLNDLWDCSSSEAQKFRKSSGTEKKKV